MPAVVPRSRSALPAPPLPPPGVLAFLFLPALPVLLLFFSAIERAVFPPPDPDAARIAALNEVYAHPRDCAARRALARLVAPNEAIPHLAAAARFHPDDPGVLCELGNAYRETRCYEKAVETYRQAVKTEGNDDPYVLCSLGSSLLRTKKHADAVEAVGYLQKAAQLSPTDPETMILFGDAEQASGRTHEARSAWQNALELDPDGPSGMKAGIRLSRSLHSAKMASAKTAPPRNDGIGVMDGD